MSETTTTPEALGEQPPVPARQLTGNRRVRIAPALGLIGLLGSLFLILANLKDLVGGSSVLAWVIVGLLIIAFAVGAVVGTRVSRENVAAS